MLDTDLLLRYESDELSEKEVITLFQQIYDTKAYEWLQGHYGRVLRHYLLQGVISI